MKKQKFKGLQKLSILQSNIITRSAQGLTLVEKRILWTALAQSGGISRNVVFSAKEYANTFDIEDVNIAYKELLYASKTFLKRYFTLPDTTTYKGKIYPAEISYSWLSYVKYSKQLGTIEIRFNQDIYGLLFDLTEQFTKYQLKQASALRSLYSWRLLELFEQMRKSIPTSFDENHLTTKTKKELNGWLKIDVDDFCHAMEAPKSYKNNFGDLNKRIIQPAIKELQEKDGWKIEFKAIKYGRKYKTLAFKFEKDKQMKLGF